MSQARLGRYYYLLQSLDDSVLPRAGSLLDMAERSCGLTLVDGRRQSAQVVDPINFLRCCFPLDRAACQVDISMRNMAMAQAKSWSWLSGGGWWRRQRNESV